MNRHDTANGRFSTILRTRLKRRKVCRKDNKQLGFFTTESQKKRVIEGWKEGRKYNKKAGERKNSDLRK
jgi:hypothetical protein